MIGVVYRVVGHEDELLYVGATAMPLADHLAPLTQLRWWPQVAEVTPEVHPDVRSAARAALEAIRDEQPWIQTERSASYAALGEDGWADLVEAFVDEMVSERRAARPDPG